MLDGWCLPFAYAVYMACTDTQPQHSAALDVCRQSDGIWQARWPRGRGAQGRRCARLVHTLRPDFMRRLHSAMVFEVINQVTLPTYPCEFSCVGDVAQGDFPVL
jgi:hypothetical protein